MLTDINAGTVHRVVLVVVININGSQVATTNTLLPACRLIILVNDDDIVITGLLPPALLLLLLLRVEDDVLLHLVTGAVLAITGLLLLNNYKS